MHRGTTNERPTQQAKTRCRGGLRNDHNAGYLTVDFPVGVFPGDAGVVHRWLHVPGLVERARGDALFTGRGIVPVQLPEYPRVIDGFAGQFLPVAERFDPGTVVDLDLGVYRLTPGGTGNAQTIGMICDAPGADFSLASPTEVSARTVSPLCFSSRIVT